MLQHCNDGHKNSLISGAPNCPGWLTDDLLICQSNPQAASPGEPLQVVIPRILVTNILFLNHLDAILNKLDAHLLSAFPIMASNWYPSGCSCWKVESSCEVGRHGFKFESWHLSWLWAHHLRSLVFGVFLCKIKMKTLYTTPTSQGCCENHVKMYVKALCNLVILQSPPFPYQIQYYSLPEGHMLIPKWYKVD